MATRWQQECGGRCHRQGPAKSRIPRSGIKAGSRPLPPGPKAIRPAPARCDADERWKETVREGAHALGSTALCGRSDQLPCVSSRRRLTSMSSDGEGARHRQAQLAWFESRNGPGPPRPPRHVVSRCVEFRCSGLDDVVNRGNFGLARVDSEFCKDRHQPRAECIEVGLRVPDFGSPSCWCQSRSRSRTRGLPPEGRHPR